MISILAPRKEWLEEKVASYGTVEKLETDSMAIAPGASYPMQFQLTDICSEVNLKGDFEIVPYVEIGIEYAWGARTGTKKSVQGFLLFSEPNASARFGTANNGFDIRTLDLQLKVDRLDTPSVTTVRGGTSEMT